MKYSKTAALSLLLMLLSHLLMAQIKKVDAKKSIEIGQANILNVWVATMHKIPAEEDNQYDYYFIQFKNNDYQQIVEIESFGFFDIDNAFNDLYISLAKGYKSKEIQMFDLPKGTLSANYAGSGMQFIWREHGVSSPSGWITKKQLANLFGKEFNKEDFK